MSSRVSTRSLGRQAEDLAAEFLHRLGYKLLERNVYFVGSELDLICELHDELIFVEVKSLRNSSQSIYETLTARKRKSLHRGLEKWLMLNKMQGRNWHFEVVGVINPESTQPGFVHLKEVEI